MSERSPNSMKPEDAEFTDAMKNADDRSHDAHQLHEGFGIEQAITVARPVSEVFGFWRDFSNHPKFMRHLDRVDIISPTRSHWIWRTLGGFTLDWQTEIIAEIHDRMISWQTLPGAKVKQAGSVWFKPSPQDQGTEIHVQIRYGLPGFENAPKFAQMLLQKVASILGQSPGQMLHEDLRRLRFILEAGEIPTTECQSHGTRSIRH